MRLQRDDVCKCGKTELMEELLIWSNCTRTTTDMSGANSTSDLRNCDLWQSKSLGVSESIYFAVGFGLIGVVGIVGNLLVVLAIITAGYMRNVTNFLLLNLAVADVGNLLACLPEVSQILFNESWSLHTLICPIVRYLQVLFLYSSVSFQVGVAAER